MKKAPAFKPAASTAKQYVPPERRAAKELQHTARLKSRRGTYGRKWSEYRLQFLRRPENAICAECRRNGRVTASQEVDHITPHQGDQVLFWDVANHQALCKPCHSRKTASHDGGFGNHRQAAPGSAEIESIPNPRRRPGVGGPKL